MSKINGKEIKAQFIKIMEELISLKQDEEYLSKAFTKFEPQMNRISFYRQEELIVKLLKLYLDDKEDWISYFIYECDCGKNPMEVKVTKNNKIKKFKLKTLNQLWWVLNN